MTAQRAVGDADAIWKFQRYHLVIDFKSRLRLPAPLNIFSFIILACESIFDLVCCCFWKKAERLDHSEVQRLQKLKSDDYKYWRNLANEYMDQQLYSDQEHQHGRKQNEHLQIILEDMEHTKNSISQLRMQLAELDKNLNVSKLALEDIKHTMTREDEKITTSQTHLLSRHANYPGTRIKRFPMADRYVPWEVLYSVYDPVVYSKPKAEFPGDLKEYIDEDLLLIREQQGPRFRPPDYKWNFVFTSVAGVTVNRESWVTHEEQPTIYRLDVAGLPVNPMGRTGLRGRGCLCRWGPNHCILLIVTRWNVADSFLQSVNTAVENKTLEFIVIRDRDTDLNALPGGFDYADKTLYNIIRNKFDPDLIEDWNTEEDMRKYFSDFARAPAGDFVDIVGEEAEQLKFEASLIHRGYLDDMRNADNAWVECEVWHYHYTGPQNIEQNIPAYLRWRKIGNTVYNKMLPSHAALLQEVYQKIVA